jgi:hypothetical protein
MRIPNPVTRANQPQHGNTVAGQTRRPATGNAVPGLCPRTHRRSANPALPPPEPLTCLARGPDCCVNSAVADVRRTA